MKILIMILLLSAISYSQQKTIAFYVDGDPSSVIKMDSTWIRSLVISSPHPLRDLIKDIWEKLETQDSVVITKKVNNSKNYEVTLKLYITGESIKDIRKRQDVLWNYKDSMEVISVIKQ